MIKISIKRGEDVIIEMQDDVIDLTTLTFKGAIGLSSGKKYELSFRNLDNKIVEISLSRSITYTMPTGTYKGEVFQVNGNVFKKESIELSVSDTVTDLSGVV